MINGVKNDIQQIKASTGKDSNVAAMAVNSEQSQNIVYMALLLTSRIKQKIQKTSSWCYHQQSGVTNQISISQHCRNTAVAPQGRQ